MSRPRLSEQRCWQHPLREAVVRCPGCRRFFCRECVTEHEDRMLCAACLAVASRPRERRRWPWATVRAVLQGGAALVLGWWFFYAAGRLLASLPNSFHEGTALSRTLGWDP